MDTESLRRLQLIQLDKERGELHEKMRIAGKRIDHFERALRREEIPLLNEDYEKQLELEKKTYEENKKTKLAAAAARHQENIKLKRRLERMLPDYNAYRATIKEKRSEEFEAREKEARVALEAEKQRRRAAYEQYLEEERRAEEEREREEEAERERLRKEEEERIAKEEATRKEAAERTRIREEERRYIQNSDHWLTKRKQDEILEKQRQREKEAEENLARRRAQQQQGAAAPPSSGLRPSPGAWRPRRNLDDSSPRPVESPRTGGSRWGNDRPTSTDRFSPMQDSTSGTKSPSRTDTPPAPAPGRYVPPARRS
jgi:translation initiation factor 3 subunit A